MSGWVLDGFPQSEEQINLLKEMKIKPSLVCVFEQAEDVCVSRVSKRRIDGQTGQVVEMDKFVPESPR